jgi:hypothetical protein
MLGESLPLLASPSAHVPYQGLGAFKPYLREPSTIRALWNIFLCPTARPTDVLSPESEEEQWSNPLQGPRKNHIVSYIPSLDVPALISSRCISLKRTKTSPRPRHVTRKSHRATHYHLNFRTVLNIIVGARPAQPTRHLPHMHATGGAYKCTMRPSESSNRVLSPVRSPP